MTRALLELESARRLSESLLWRLNRDYFNRTGVAAWRNNIVPSYITTNSFLARAYAGVLYRYLLDCAAVADPRRAIRIVELGAATGKLAFLILRELELLEQAGGGDLPHFQYVITDCARANVMACRKNPRLAPFVVSGRLDFALCDAEVDGDAPLTLLYSGETLVRAGNPVALVANYVFDGIRHDGFRVEDGALSELHVELGAAPAASGGLEPDDPALLDRVTATWVPRGPSAGPTYADATLQHVVDHYRASLERAAFLIPVGAIACLRRFQRFAGGELLVVAADKGVSVEGDLEGRYDPNIAAHGSLSVGVNFHALGLGAEHLGGRALHAPGHGALSAAAFVFGDAARLAPTCAAFTRELGRGGALDVYDVLRPLSAYPSRLQLETLLSALRLAAWDANLAARFAERLVELAPSAFPAEARLLRAAMIAAAANLYPANGGEDVAFALGSVRYELGDFGDAAALFRASIADFPGCAETHFRLALCLSCLGWNDQALEEVRAALALEPKHTVALLLRDSLEA